MNILEKINLLKTCFAFISCFNFTGAIRHRSRSFQSHPPVTPVSYDFIVVGGGTAGCTVASRLSENGKFSVLLLEAGGLPPEFMDVPGLAMQNQLIPELTYQYSSIPQRHAALNNGGIVPVPLGRVLGGTSSINYNFINRGHPSDYDNWANYTSDESWKYSNMLQFFKKSETYLGEFPSDQHGYNGPITVSHQNYAPGRDIWLEAGKEMGYPVSDPNGPQRANSFTPVEFSRRFGRRVSSYTGYIKPIMNSRRNLKVLTNANVSKVLFQGNTAIGVQYKANSTTSYQLEVAFVNKEIILSAGTYGSPSLLMRSGVGPKDVLTKAKIQILKELPVGENFQDHPMVPIQIILNNKSLSLDPATDWTPENFELFEKYGVGPYTSVGGFGGQIFLSSSVAIRDGHPNWPDIHVTQSSLTTRVTGFQNVSIAPWETSITAYIALSREKSRGTVKLDPKNVNGTPIIDFNFLSNPIDEDVYLHGINFILNMFETTNSYRRVGARYLPHSVPGCEHLVFRSEKYWRCYIRQTLLGGNHPSSTCSMNHVVDSNLRVLGMQRLRVVDASVMPFITDANLQAVVYAIAEKISNGILQDWKR